MAANQEGMVGVIQDSTLLLTEESWHAANIMIVLFVLFVLLWARVELPDKLPVSLFKEVVALQFDVLICAGYCSSGNTHAATIVSL